ncbi:MULTISPECIES: hypothetical protein [unclassified Shimia]|uniref:hypothetical protein n=1 Tax=unclassified Shimia TaxID=2630038 RepID=UPI001ADC0FAB|nr:hypothetical protein [Shimia sp. R9_3]MBO9401559.1 hypothetical protein [Shimia sp. R9_3]
MRTPVLILLTSTLALTACQSRLNPVNWFDGSGKSNQVVEGNPLIPDAEEEGGRSIFARDEIVAYVGQPVTQVSNVEVHRVTEGQLVMAVGVSSVHGTHDARLIARDGGVEGGVLTLDFLAIPPENPILGGSDLTREITTAVVLTDQQMAGVRTIRVAAANNTLDRRAR